MAKATTTKNSNAGDAPNEAVLMSASPVFLVSAPAGPRRRAGFGFGPAVTELTLAEVEAVGDPEEIVTAWRNDPFLKLDIRYDHEPAPTDD
jgi:hypothetical protein